MAEHYQNIIKSTPKAIIIFPHSSYFDYFFCLLYKWAYELEDFYVIMTERFSFVRLSNIIYAPDVYMRSYMNKGFSKMKSFFYCWKDILFHSKYQTCEYKKQNFVSHVCESVKHKDKYKIVISPTGSTSKRHWRSGFFYIAKELNIPIIIAGVDYKNKTIVVNGKLNYLTDYESCKILAEPLIDSIPSFHNTKDLNIVNWSVIFTNIIKTIIIYKFVTW
jgi:1-acyl-sn-glycerol-3-phosphate acyltransferase